MSFPRISCDRVVSQIELVSISALEKKRLLRSHRSPSFCRHVHSSQCSILTVCLQPEISLILIRLSSFPSSFM